MSGKSPNNPESPAGKVLYACTVLILVIAFIGVFQLNANPGTFEGSGYSEGNRHYREADQYALLGDALLHGRLQLDLPVPDELASLENPYSIEDRLAIGSEDVPIFWDHAFYEGSYYCYFGVVPAILVYAPYQLVTGAYLPTPQAIGFIGVLAIGAVALLIRRIGLRYFGKSSTTLSHIACLLIAFSGCNFAYLAFVARFYSIPIVSSLLFTSLGLWFWMGARRERKGAGSRRSGAGSLSAWRLAAGSTCMALNLGCRPQFMLAAFFAFPIFADEIFRTRDLFSKRGLAGTAAALAPFAVIVSALLAYNYARFGSVLNFGSDYNLTGFDMTEYHQRWGLTGILAFTYLLAPPDFSWAFPYVETVNTQFPEYGFAPYEPFFGGFFLIKPIQVLALLFPLVHRDLGKRGLLGFSVLCAAFTCIVLVVDIRVAGITQRYFSDFGLYVALASCLVLFSLQSRMENRKPAVLKPAAVAAATLALAFTFAFGALSLFSPDRYDSIAVNNPELNQQITSLFG